MWNFESINPDEEAGNVLVETKVLKFIVYVLFGHFELYYYNK